MSLIFVILGVLLGLHLGYRAVCVTMLKTDETYSDKTRLILSLFGFIAMFDLATWLSVNALTIMFGM